ncbi:rolling circle replication-associated protein, partial [Staphylococcus aureus]
FNELGLETSISISKYKIITTGSITEIYESENGYVRELNRMVDTTRREIGNNGMTENERIEKDMLNLKTSLNRSQKHLKRLINANIGAWGTEKAKFITLTFKSNIKNHETANPEFKKFIMRLNYFVFKDKKARLKYTCCVERQTRGALHYHVVFYNLPYVKQKDLLKVWQKGKYGGSLCVNAIDDVDNVGVYVAKYITKEINDMKMQFTAENSPEFREGLIAMNNGHLINKFSKLSAKKLYFSSRGLIQPEVEYTNDYDKVSVLLEMAEKEGYQVDDFKFKNTFDGNEVCYRQIKPKLD